MPMVEFDYDITPSITITITITIRGYIAFSNEVCFRQTMLLASITITQHTILHFIIARVPFNNTMGISRYLYYFTSIV